MNDELIEALYPATPTQAGMLFHSLYQPESDVYQIQIVYRIEGALDEAVFERCWNRALERHAILRTAFVMDTRDEPLQAVWKKASIRLERHDLTALSAGERRVRIDAHLEAGRRPFSPDAPPLIRLLLLQESPSSSLFVWTVHHALLDGWSKSIVISELFADYQREASGSDGDFVPESPTPFRDYVAWLQEQNRNETKAQSFWRDLLRGFLQATPLPIAPARSPGPRRADRWNESARERRLSRELTDRIRGFARSNRTTVNVVLQAAWAAVLSRYSGEEDVVFGATVSTRPPSLAGAETMVGPLLNTVPIRAGIGPADSTRSLLQSLRNQQRARSPHETTPLTDILTWSEVSRRAPLFESVFVFENFPEDAFRSPDGALDVRREFTIQRTNYALEFVVFPESRLLLLIGFDPHRFDASAVEVLLSRIEILIEGMVQAPDVPIVDLPMATAEELSLSFEGSRGERAVLPSVVQMFEREAVRDPDALALASIAAPGRGRRASRGARCTYGELNARSNRLAHHLLRRGVGPDAVVGVCVGRSFEMVVGVLGILKAGGAYLPLDPAYPAERLRYMVEDAGAQFLLVDGETKSAFPALADRTIVLDRSLLPSSGESDENPVTGASPRDLAYVIYTSGSTGMPKGVEVEHRSLSNYIAAVADRFNLSPADRVLQFASLGFDVAAEEIFATLSRGATVVLRSDEMIGSTEGFLERCRESKITVLDLPTSYWHELVAEAANEARDLPETLRLVIIGGESAMPERVARWLELSGGRVRLLNAYGPTEATVTATFWEAPPGEFTAGRVPIGRPIPNVRVHVLDAALKPVPPGIVGELWIGGAGVARGYRNRPALNAERFLPDPFSEGGTLYRTGDRGRIGPGGDLEYLGRLDGQVKIRGFRVEVGEIEAALRRVSGVREAVVQVREDASGRKRLAAYIVPESEGAPARSALRAGLGVSLPDHMVPSDFVFLDALPMTPNGKIDFKALPAPEHFRSELEDDFVAPRTELEARIARIWSEILAVDRVGVHDNFFDLGGHSLLAMRLLARVERDVGAGLSLAAIFRSPRVADIAAIFEEGRSQKAQSPSLVPIQPKGINPPFFCVHADSGIVYYRRLARVLGADQPFYGVQSQGLDGRGGPLETVEEMAAHYLREIRAFQPEGPYYLGGHSFGGKVAFEMARHLAVAGQRTALLAVFDTAASPSPASSGASGLELVRRRTRMHVQTLRHMAARDRMSYVMGRLETVRSILSRTVSRVAEFLLHPLRRAQRRVREANIRAAKRYVPGYYEGRVTVFRATERGGVTLLDSQLGWGELCAGGVEVHEVPGDHSSILLEDSNLRMLGARLRECLRGVREAERLRSSSISRDALSR
ncbi:MAG: amino acid adenylation domain-containing protein [Acidobacteriota bacterium]|nr:amino acid adenylation domain-containing protein [Acidobacteriota bacterium]